MGGTTTSVQSFKMAATPDFTTYATYVQNACKTAEEFIAVYYNTMDKRRELIDNLYMDQPTLIWNGCTYSGLDALAKFYKSMPSSDFQISMLDCQPVPVQAPQAEATLLILTSGTVKFEGYEQLLFNQSFLLTAQSTSHGTVWKIANEYFRCQDLASMKK